MKKKLLSTRRKREDRSLSSVVAVTSTLRSLGIRAWREQQGMKQLEFAFAAKISINTLRKYEHYGGWPLSIDATDKVCKHLDRKTQKAARRSKLCRTSKQKKRSRAAHLEAAEDDVRQGRTHEFHSLDELFAFMGDYIER